MKINNTYRLFLLTVVATMSSSVAFAVRDAADMIAQPRENKKVAEERIVLKDVSDIGTSKRIVLPLDHGPHAVTTPAANRKRLAAAVANTAASDAHSSTSDK